ncbi:DUF484 family protein [Wenzhouxiangella marina]|uniref:Phytochrome sensor protein n=1 Tax=Wenzhouxiangella marina TaxID=1579979 RepID=A0A0K0XX92_9GAMM|nr:DUF484 family protein [Wenzhouxiangella marina]AKS42303.1 phytochrome sensor protein [Wenzhouxiangella marina]MBB6085924.1 hypothetical protein [Wenzhouxiangella marina]
MTTDDVLNWLGEHPDVLIEHPELLERLQLPHDAGATSLIERQVERLRASNRKLEQQLEALTRVAAENEQLSRRLHGLTLAVLAESRPEDCLAELIARLREDFQADAVSVHLIDPEPSLAAINEVHAHAELPEALKSLAEPDRIQCGRLTREKLGLLFGSEADSIASAAVVPLGSAGLLAIGATQQDRFHPGMGTLFLELLAQTVLARLNPPAAHQRKRA